MMPALGPVEILRRIRAIVEDADLSPAERLALVCLAVNADGQTGLSCGSVRLIRKRTGLSYKVICAALDAAQDRHVGKPEGGQRGVHRFPVLPVQPVPSAPPGEARDPASAPSGEARDPASAPSGEARDPASAPLQAAQRSTEGSESCCSIERKQRERTLSPPVRAADNGNSSNGDDEALGRLAFPGGATDRQRAALVNAATGARRAGAPEAALRAVLRTSTGKPWLILDRLAERFARTASAPPRGAHSAPLAEDREPPAPGLPGVIASIRGSGVRVLHTVDGRHEAEVLDDEGDDSTRGLPVRVYAASDTQHTGLGIRRRLWTAESLAEFDLSPEGVPAEAAVS